ncbi:vacuolar protein-sorting-associated protein 36 [Holotrichia oblita]|uniref:Vacuolar protein-sorting-associated protein 36 n=1 Tax=Holotrichia oblita TaxID=644536 RepID=A0ACB9T6E1_HOLOL|nr:vacuolar protein-sorting-associated protein 36 [Holotrichia oblita]
MNRFEYTESSLIVNEQIVAQDINIRLYDGEQKTVFESGEVFFTTHRVIWCNPGELQAEKIVLSLPLYLVKYIEEESPSTFSFSKSKKIVLHLHDPLPDRNEGPQISSLYDYIKLSFREGYRKNFASIIQECLRERRWEIKVQTQSLTRVSQIKLRTGIVGIERSIQEKQKATDKSISIAFQDLDKLMTMAKEMVRLSNNISAKIREKQGDITEDETVRFKSYLLSLGIDDPVTRDSYKSDHQYYRSLAKQISDIITEPLSDVGGMMALTDVFCRVNRARGLELLSPEDLLNACRVMDSLNLPLKLHHFDSGVKVLQLQTLDDENVATTTSELIEDKGSLTPEELAQLLNISVLLSRQRLLVTESCGKCCRDESIEGLRFYPNLFLTRD